MHKIIQHNSVLYFIFSLLLLQISITSQASAGYYENQNYLFSICYGDYVSHAITDKPPNPNHGVGLKLHSGGEIEVNGDWCGVKDLYDDIVKDCKVEKTNTQFKRYYICADSIHAFLARQVSKECIYYNISYHNYNGSKEELAIFKKILASFKKLSRSRWNNPPVYNDKD